MSCREQLDPRAVGCPLPAAPRLPRRRPPASRPLEGHPLRCRVAPSNIQGATLSLRGQASINSKSNHGLTERAATASMQHSVFPPPAAGQLTIRCPAHARLSQLPFMHSLCPTQLAIRVRWRSTC
ncbi:hypothetical protein GCM10010522_57260 [Kribbella solani]